MSIDINQLAQEAKYAFTLEPTEHPEDKAARLERERLDAALSRKKELWLFLAVLAGVATIGLLCLSLVLGYGQPSADDKKWAFGVLSSIVTGGVGALAGKRLK